MSWVTKSWIARVARSGSVAIGILSLGGSLGSGGCGGPPHTRAAQSDFVAEADATLEAMRGESPQLDAVLDRAYGYVVFPRIGKGGLLLGGAHGNGVVYEGGLPVGLVELNQASIGAQLGGQTFSEIVVFETAADLEELKDGRFSFGANASAVIITAGAGRGIEFQDGVAIVIKPRGGVMVDLSVSGQNLSFQRMRPPRA